VQKHRILTGEGRAGPGEVGALPETPRAPEVSGVPDRVQQVAVRAQVPSMEQLPVRVREWLPGWDQPATMSVVGTYEGYYLAVNEGFSRVLGWSAAELGCAPIWEFMHPDDQQRLVESRDRVLREGGVGTGYESRRLCRDGSYRWTRWDSVADRATERLYGVGIDISDEKPVERAHVVVGVWIRDVLAGTSIWSEELYGMFGLSRQDMVTDEVMRARIHPQDRPLVDGAWRASMADDDGHAANYRVVRPDGTVRQLRSIGRVICRDGGRPRLIRGLTLDRTDFSEIASRPQI